MSFPTIKQLKKDWAIKKKYLSLRIQATAGALAAVWILLPDSTQQDVYSLTGDFFSIKPSTLVLGVALATAISTFYKQKSVAEAQAKQHQEEMEDYKRRNQLIYHAGNVPPGQQIVEDLSAKHNIYPPM